MEHNQRFAKLAAELAARDPDLRSRLADVRAAAERLRELAAECVQAFCTAARGAGAPYLAEVRVSEVEPDKKHIDCVQFSVRRGRYELVIVAIASASGAKVRLVGPFRRGSAEGPCADGALRGDEVEAALVDRIEALLREAAGA